MSLAAYYNEWEPYPAQWLRNLMAAGHIPQGEVDERSITEVQPDDLRGFTQCHFFAGIGGWAYAARLAGWPDDRELWTGSCPCQPFSGLGNRRGTDDPRHLWPAFYRLINERRPSVVFGEQIAGQGGPRWLSGVRDDLLNSGYAVGFADLPAGGFSAPQERHRLWFCAVGDAESIGRGKSIRFIHPTPGSRSITRQSAWTSEAVVGADGERRRAEPGVFSLAHGIPNRVEQLRAYGNSIVPQVAAEVIAAFMECRP